MTNHLFPPSKLRNIAVAHLFGTSKLTAKKFSSACDWLPTGVLAKLI
jgi:hypothetical protein